MTYKAETGLVLVGFPGAGKTTVGRRLAVARNVPFADSDEEVERSAGRAIADIFAREGEAGFRIRERLAVAELVARGKLVIALGGGAFDDEVTRSAVLACCTVIWLDVPSNILIERLRGGEHRPLLAEGDPAAMLSRLAYRARFYAEAQLRVGAETSEGMVAGIQAALG